jgi:hypothetical protein
LPYVCLFFLAGSLVLGAAAGVVWWLVVQPPAYELNSNGGATTSERGLTQFIAGDAWFCAIGLVVGLLIGLAAWRWLLPIGWPVVLVVLGCAVASALTCWLVVTTSALVSSRLDSQRLSPESRCRFRLRYEPAPLC